MSDVLRLVARQLAGDARALPRGLRERAAGRARVERCATIAELRAAARRALPPVIFDFVDGAANDEVTAARNVRDFAELAIAPRALVDVATVDCSTTVLGERIATPLIGAPTGLCGLVHHDGEVALARALHGAGSIYSLAAMSSYSVEEVAAAAPGPVWFQTYMWRDRELVAALLERARAAGVETLVVTTDVPVSAARDRDRRNGFGLPPRATLRTAAAALRRPRWTWALVRRPRLAAANVAGHGGPRGAVDVAAYIDEQFDPAADWDYLGWMRERWEGRLVVKGILRAEDAARAVATGADAICVSNHGGRQLDHADSAIRALPAVVDAVGDRAEVYLDGGVRRGSDLLKALALGARACLVGRPLLYGLGAGGPAGAERAVAILTAELRAAMTLAGVPSLAAADRSLVLDRRAAGPRRPDQTTGGRTDA